MHTKCWSLAAVALLAAASPLPAQTRAQFELIRHALVDTILVPAGIKNPRVIEAMKATPRHEFVPANIRAKSYFDTSLPIGEQQTISSPLIVAQMTQALDPQPGDKVLEIGTGSGYQAAVLSSLVKDVYTIEIVQSLGKSAERTLARLGPSYKNVHTKIGDGFQGWPEFAPFDKIIVTCSPEKPPQPLIDQLAEGGLMLVPAGERYRQTLYKLRKKNGQIESEALIPTLFVPMTGKAEQARQVKPDPKIPHLYNGSFEDEDASKFKDGAQPGWYYERLAAWKTDERSPDGKHYIEFKSTDHDLDGHLMQGFAIDGTEVRRLEVSGWMKTENVVPGPNPDQSPFIAFTLYDDQRRDLGLFTIGPFRGTSGWHRESQTFEIPPQTREGIFRIGLFGATGTACFDKLEIKKVQRP